MTVWQSLANSYPYYGHLPSSTGSWIGFSISRGMVGGNGKTFTALLRQWIKSGYKTDECWAA